MGFFGGKNRKRIGERDMRRKFKKREIIGKTKRARGSWKKNLSIIFPEKANMLRFSRKKKNMTAHKQLLLEEITVKKVNY